MSAGALAALAERAVKWSAATTAARFALQLAAQVALARLLGPDNYGVYGIGIAVLTFLAFLCGSSFSLHLMLQPQVTNEDIRFSFTWQVVVGLAGAIAMYATAPALAAFFGDARVEGMLQLLSVACLLNAASAPATCLLQRDLDFRRLGLIQLAAYAAGYLAVGVPMALAGQGATALGAAAVVQAGVVLVLSCALRPHPMRPLFMHPGSGAAVATGRTVIATNMVNWLLGNIDRVWIGRVLNAEAVGLYNAAYNLAAIPNTLLLGVLQPIFFATGARLQQDPDNLARGWRAAMSCVLVLTLPVAVVLAILSADLVHLLYGSAWAASAWVLALLFLCLPAWVAFGITTPVLWNTGRKQRESLLQLPLLALALPAWWWAAPQGIRAVAAVSGLVLLARALLMLGAALRALRLPWSVLAAPFARGIALAGAAAAAARLGQHLAAAAGLPVVALAAGSAGALSVALLVAFAWPHLLGAEARAVLARFLPFLRVPAEPPLVATGAGTS